MEAYRRWLTAGGRSPRTIAGRLQGAARLLRGAGYDPTAITASQVIDYMASVPAAWSRHTYYQHAASFAAFLDSQAIPAGFMRGVPKPVTPRGVPRPMDRTELRSAIDAAGPRAAMMLRLAAFAGLRVSEIAMVRGEDVGQSIFVTGKGGHRAMIPTHPCITAAAAADDFPVHGWWFVNRAGDPMTRISVWRAMTEALRAVGCTATPHQARHLYGTALLEAGADVRVVQVAMRHASLATTARYLLVTDERLRAAVHRLPQ
jgi:integrase/recombinase XerD